MDPGRREVHDAVASILTRERRATRDGRKSDPTSELTHKRHLGAAVPTSDHDRSPEMIRFKVDFKPHYDHQYATASQA